jgi:hypothetical protein
MDIWEDYTKEQLDELEDSVKGLTIIKMEFAHDYAWFTLNNGWEITGHLDKNPYNTDTGKCLDGTKPR